MLVLRRGAMVKAAGETGRGPNAEEHTPMDTGMRWGMARSHPRPYGGPRRMSRTGLGAGLAIVAMLLSAIVQPAGADVASCRTFETQADAQAALDQNPEFASTLDADGNGVACDEFTGGPPVVDLASCGHYDTQAGAQENLDAHPEFAAPLDPDGDGIACEDAFGTEPQSPVGGVSPPVPGTTSPAAPVTGLPNTGAGTAGTVTSGTTLLVLLGLGSLLVGGAAMGRRRFR